MTQWTVQSIDNEGNAAINPNTGRPGQYWINEYGAITWDDPNKAPAADAGRDPNAYYVWQGRYTNDGQIIGGKWVDVRTIKDKGDGWDPNSQYSATGDYPPPGKVAEPAGYAAFDKTTPTPIFKTDKGFIFDGQLRSDWTPEYVARANQDADNILRTVDQQHQAHEQAFADTVFQVGGAALAGLGGMTALSGMGMLGGGAGSAGTAFDSWDFGAGFDAGGAGAADIGAGSNVDWMSHYGDPFANAGDAGYDAAFRGGASGAGGTGLPPSYQFPGLTGSYGSEAEALKALAESPTTSQTIKDAVTQVAKAAGAVASSGAIDWGKVAAGLGGVGSGVLAGALAQGGPQDDIQKAMAAYGNPQINFDPKTAYTGGGAGADGGVSAGTVRPIDLNAFKIDPAQRLAALAYGEEQRLKANPWEASGNQGKFMQQAGAWATADPNTIMMDPEWKLRQQAVMRANPQFSGAQGIAAANASSTFYEDRGNYLGKMAMLGNPLGAAQVGVQATQGMMLNDVQKAELGLKGEQAASQVSYQQNLLDLDAGKANQLTATQRAQQALEAERARADTSYKSASLGLDAAKISELARQFNAELTGKALGAIGGGVRNIYDAQADSTSSMINQFLKQQLLTRLG